MRDQHRGCIFCHPLFYFRWKGDELAKENPFQEFLAFHRFRHEVKSDRSPLNPRHHNIPGGFLRYRERAVKLDLKLVLP